MLIAYTDGSCSMNPGPGGFGVVVYESDSELIVDVYQESCNNTTNNREEIKAILWVLENWGEENLIVYSDSAYCVNTFNTWIHNWKQNGWTRAKGKKIENLDLIKQYDKLIQEGKKIDLRKCSGHAGNTWNEIADGLATKRLSADKVIKEYSND